MDRVATDAMAVEEVMIKREEVSGLLEPALTAARSRSALSPKAAAMLRLDTDDKEVVGGAARSIEVVVVSSDPAAVLTQIARLALSHESPGASARADHGRSEARSDAASAVADDRLVDEGTGVIRARVESARYAELIACLQALGKTTTQERSTGGATSALKKSKALDVGTAKGKSANGQILVDKKGAAPVAEAHLSQGGLLAFIGDQDAGRKGVFVDFFGQPASTYKSIGLLAMQAELPIIVTYARRRGNTPVYDAGVQRVIYPREWAEQDDPLRWITQAYTSAIEDFVREAPEQYLWIHRRWKSQPKQRSR